MDTQFKRTNFVWEELVNNFTDDIAQLRYNGPVQIFLTGSLVQTETMKAFMDAQGLKSGVDLVTSHYRIQTLTKFCSYRINGNTNIKPSSGMFIKYDDVVHPQPLTPRIVRGKLISCSLRMIQALDRYYKQGYDTHRVPIRVAPQWQPEQPTTASAYLFKKTTLFRKTEGSTAWHLKDGLSIRPDIIDGTQTGGVYTAV